MVALLRVLRCDVVLMAACQEKRVCYRKWIEVQRGPQSVGHGSWEIALMNNFGFALWNCSMNPSGQLRRLLLPGDLSIP